jgi:hypothetical protein
MNAKELAEYCASPPEPEEGEEPLITPDLGIVGENLFSAYLPSSPDNCIAIYDTGGWAKDPDIPRTDLTFQFVFRAASYDEVQALIKKFKDWFIPEGIPKKLFYIGTHYIHLVQPLQPTPFYLGMDENERYKYSWNFTFIVH